MPVTQFRKPGLTPAQRRIEAIVKVAGDLGMGGFALAKLRTAATEQICAMEQDAVSRCARLADELAEKHEKDGKPDMAFGSKMTAEAIRIFAVNQEG